MKPHRRIKRMERNHKRNKTPSLNLIALMDIFTVLVFFLLINTTNSHQIPRPNEITLPNARLHSTPEETLVISITKSQILLEGRPVEEINEISEKPLFGLENALTQYSQRDEENKTSKKITILGDEKSSYALIRKILSTCQNQGFTKIDFAAMQKKTIK